MQVLFTVTVHSEIERARTTHHDTERAAWSRALCATTRQGVHLVKIRRIDQDGDRGVRVFALERGQWVSSVPAPPEIPDDVLALFA